MRRITSERLRHRVTIQTVTIASDVETWADTYTSVPAAIEPLQGREYWEAQKINAECTTRITIRYRSGILPSMRVKWGSRIYRIVAPPINVEERNRELQLMTVEVVD